MTNQELNDALRILADKKEFAPEAMDKFTCGNKSIAYLGWFWRDVDFDDRIYFVRAMKDDDPDMTMIGFCQNNKWDYEGFIATVDESWHVRVRAEAFATSPSKERAAALFDYMQKLVPSDMVSED